MTHPRSFPCTIAFSFAPFALALWAAAGCQSSPGGATGFAGTGGAGAGGAAGAGGGQAGTNGGPGDASAEEVFDPTAGCPEVREPLRKAGGTLALTIQPRLGGKPFVFGEPNALPSGGTVTPLNFRFYVSHVTLLRATGTPVPVDIVTAAGAVVPYGIHLYNAEDPAAEALRVLAPPGDYTGVAFTLGIDDACNSYVARNAKRPLTDDSQMVWPHLQGYLFLRYEARVAGDGGAPPDAGDGGSDAAVDGVATADAAAASSDAAFDGGAPPSEDGGPPTTIHMGGFPGMLFAPTVEARGAFSVAASPAAARSLRVDMGAVFEAATTPLAPGTLSIPVFQPDGERLFHHAARFPLFVLAP